MSRRGEVEPVGFRKLLTGLSALILRKWYLMIWECDAWWNPEFLFLSPFIPESGIPTLFSLYRSTDRPRGRGRSLHPRSIASRHPVHRKSNDFLTMQPPGIYNVRPSNLDGCQLTSTQHHRLTTTSAPSSNPSVLSGASSARLNEFFELIRNEFETANQDGTIWKAQRDEYESKSGPSLLLSN